MQYENKTYTYAIISQNWTLACMPKQKIYDICCVSRYINYNVCDKHQWLKSRHYKGGGTLLSLNEKFKRELTGH